MSAGFNFDGGHTETKGIDTNGNVITVPLHKHKVSMSMARFELEGRLDLDPEWAISLRVPVDIRDQRASIETVDPATQTEYEAMLRNQDLHHRSKTYASISDLTLIGSYRIGGIAGERGSLRLSFGVGLPIGKTEENPYELGNNGQQHLHIQFGAGTFVPVLEAALTVPLDDEFLLSTFAATRLPFYENGDGYLAPPDLFGGLRATWLATNELMFGAGAVLILQGYGGWDGERDVNTGFISFSAVAGAMYRLDTGWNLRLDVLIPIVQDTLANNSEAFTQGLMLVFASSWSFTP